jgi:hypothetical protein
MALLLAGCSSGPGTSLEGDTLSCNDGRDNDGDGLVDCQDPGCAVLDWCTGVPDAGRPDAGRPDAARPDAGPIPGPQCGDPIDIVFVIDVSTSMRDEVEGIRRGVDSIAARALSLSSNVQFGLVVFVDDVEAVDDCRPFATTAELRTELTEWESFTTSNAQPGGSPVSNTDCPENSLDALYAAATRCSWRTGSLHILIHVTDDTFAERPTLLSGSGFAGDGVPVERTYAETVEALVSRQIRVGAFAAPGAGEECGAGSRPDVGRGFHAPYLGMPSIPDATRGRAWSIRDVRAGTLDMATAVSEFTADEYCTLY